MIRGCVWAFLLWSVLGAAAAWASSRVTKRPVFPTMDYTLTKLGDTATRIIFHTTYPTGDASGNIPFLGYTIDSSEKWLRVVVWYDIRDARVVRPVARHDTVYFHNGAVDSVRLVSAVIYRDSVEYPFSQTDWNIADSLYFFSSQNSGGPPQPARLRVRPQPGTGEMRIENPEQVPVTGLELLTEGGKLLRKMAGTTTVFSTRGLQSGIYFLRLRSRYGNQVEIVLVGD